MHVIASLSSHCNVSAAAPLKFKAIYNDPADQERRGMG